MKQLKMTEEYKSNLPIRAIQFGEGNFLRGFIDWMLKKLNDNNLFNGRVLAIQPTKRGRVLPKLLNQDCLFTTILHGVVDGQDKEECEVINTIAKVLNPYDNAMWKEILEYAKDENIKFVFSNTTEAGICYQHEDDILSRGSENFPAKLTAFLWKRFEHFKGQKGSGLIIVPCELIEDNGTKLKEIVLTYAKDFNFGEDFVSYLENECQFLNTLVDRVVSGYPTNNYQEYEEQLGYKDELMTCGEIFHFFAIEGDDSIKEALPFEKIGLNVVVDKDITPYRLRKVRILNGGHTANVPAALLAGLDTVDEMMSHEVIGKFARSVIFDEIIPAVNLDKAMLTSFANDVVNRFIDKSMHHQLASICMNSTSKIKARVLPSLLDARAKGVLPYKLCFAIAAYIALYKDCKENDTKVLVNCANSKTKEFVDDAYAINVLAKAWEGYKRTEDTAKWVVKSVLSDTKLWGSDLSSDIDVVALVAKLLHAIMSDGVVNTQSFLLDRA